jgi:hypothetical protein
VEIARQLVRELHSVTEMLKRMEADGLIVRYKGTGRSKVEVKLTAQGLDVFGHSLHNETDKRLLSVLSKKERERLAASLRKLRRHILQDLGIPEWRVGFPVDPNGEWQVRDAHRAGLVGGDSDVRPSGCTSDLTPD